jgi:hypothetical protein
VAVSLLVFPERAHGLGVDAAARILGQLANALPKLLTGFTQNLADDVIRRIQDDIGEAVTGPKQSRPRPNASASSIS